MKRLLAYLFIVLGLGFVINTSIYSNTYASGKWKIGYKIYPDGKTYYSTSKTENFADSKAYNKCMRGGVKGAVSTTDNICLKFKTRNPEGKVTKHWEESVNKFTQTQIAKAEPSQTQKVVEKVKTNKLIKKIDLLFCQSSTGFLSTYTKDNRKNCPTWAKKEINGHEWAINNNESICITDNTFPRRVITTKKSCDFFKMYEAKYNGSSYDYTIKNFENLKNNKLKIYKAYAYGDKTGNNTNQLFLGFSHENLEIAKQNALNNCKLTTYGNSVCKIHSSKLEKIIKDEKTVIAKAESSEKQKVANENNLKYCVVEKFKYISSIRSISDSILNYEYSDVFKVSKNSCKIATSKNLYVEVSKKYFDRLTSEFKFKYTLITAKPKSFELAGLSCIYNNILNLEKIFWNNDPIGPKNFGNLLKNIQNDLNDYEQIQVTSQIDKFNNKYKELKQRYDTLHRIFFGGGKIKKKFIGPELYKQDCENSLLANNKSTVTPKTKVKIGKVEEPKQEEFKPENKVIDNDAPVIEIAQNITVNDTSYVIEGKVSDKSDKIFVEIDGQPIEVKKGKFKVNRYSPVDEQIKIVAVDQWGNKSEPKLVDIKIELRVSKSTSVIEPLNPSNLKVKADRSKVALVIGVEKYENTPSAKFASLDAKYFKDYARKAFGVLENNINLLTDEEANLSKTTSAFFKWLPSKIKSNKTDLIIFYAGHGLASSNGEDKYILPFNADPDLLSRTAISRKEIFDQIISLKPRSVTIFLDTCYSGVSRDEQMLLASARPLRVIVEDNEKLPDNFTIFSASENDQISSGLESAKHGIFSYYLMKGLEGKADLDQDGELTNNELLTYLNNNVSEKALDLGRKQNPSLAGDPDKVLISYR